MGFALRARCFSLQAIPKSWKPCNLGDQFFYQMSGFCSVKIAILPPSYHTTTVAECLVDDIRFAETCKLTLYTFLKIFIGLTNGSLQKELQ